MTSERTWIEFEIWHGETAIAGYMALEEADDESPLNFYDNCGFECYDNIGKTKSIVEPVNAVEEAIVEEWEEMVDWISETDVVQWLVDFAEESHIEKFPNDMELYINCSRLNNEKNDVVVKDTTIRVKQTTKEKLKKIGTKGMSYDDIINELILMHGQL